MQNDKKKILLNSKWVVSSSSMACRWLKKTGKCQPVYFTWYTSKNIRSLVLRTHRQAIGNCSYIFWKGNCLEFVEKGAFCWVAPTRVWGGSCLELDSALLLCCTGDLGTKTLTRYNLSTRYQVGVVSQRATLLFG